MEMTSCIGDLVELDSAFFTIQDHENTHNNSFKSSRPYPHTSS